MSGEEHPEHLYGYNAGVQAAWARVMEMANSLPMEPVTHGAKVMRDTALDIADAVLELKKRVPGGDAIAALKARSRSSRDGGGE